MDKALLQQATKLNKDRKKRKLWQRVVRGLAVVVVFCTAYALILPAITMEKDPICGIEAHEHQEECFQNLPVYYYTCPEETEVILHSHNALCVDAQGNLQCQIPERYAHLHSESCYSEDGILTCTLEQITEHLHEASCFDANGDLICPITAAVRHEHTDSCRILSEEVNRVLICTKEVHIHSDLCFPVEEVTQAPVSEYLCGSAEHSHTDVCLDTEGNLHCTVPEHSHEAACLVADLDMLADIESSQQWEETIKGIALTGNYPTDLLNLANSQLGYQESARNVILENGKLKGYTRYGEWYGSAYGDWCAMFVSFCLHYAGVENFPLNAYCPTWIEELNTAGLYRTPDSYLPRPGDLVFFDWDLRLGVQEDASMASDHVGIITEVIPGTEASPAQIKTIEGNSSNAVSNVTYDLTDVAIIGYAAMPTGNTVILTHRGTDYTVTVRFGMDAGIPENAELSVREIPPDTEEYAYYYNQSVAELTGRSGSESDELHVTFARFFDISFLVDGQILEPTAPVDIQIQYDDAIDMETRNSGVAVHFAEEGIEVLEAETSQESGEEGQVDTFEFTQGSFSVTGTVVANYNSNVGITKATRVDFNTLKTGSTQYILYTQYNGNYYAMYSKPGDVVGYAVPVTVSGDGTITWETTDNRMFWAFTRNGNYGSSYYVQNFSTARYLHAFDNSTATRSDYGTITGGRNASTLTRQSDGSFIAQGNGRYTGISVGSNGEITFNRVNNQSQAARFYLGQVGDFYNVWFDGTNGGMMSYYGADNLNLPAVKNGNGSAATVTLPETWKSTEKYPYKLQGWYNINTRTYYPVDPNDGVDVTVQITADTVFYADWVAENYDMGQHNEHTVESIDTSQSITTYVFDYNVLFNVLSSTHTGTISAGSHSETWSMVTSGKVPYQNHNSLNFAFVDYDANGDFSYANGRDNDNVNQGEAITAGILQRVYNRSGEDLLELLFDPNVQVIGKHYVGTGNYLFQYMDSTTENYDGIHDGYYYLDARLNAASYNQSQQRFYLYDYLERTSDSRKDGGVGQYSDFLPFNSPYMFEADQLDAYNDTIMRSGYEYDAKDGASSYQEYNSVDDAATNYFFGIRTDIEFFLPNDAGSQDEYGNYGNISTRGEHMIFDFHGDDDVWVFVDGELILDIGGLHGVMFGQIDFSTGTVISGKDGGTTQTRTFQEILGKNITEGTHTITIYYMERGSSQSNCAIYFNVAPRYDLEITKEDIFTVEALNGAIFSVYNDEALTDPAQLWESEEAHKQDMEDGEINDATNSFLVVDGKAKCWGISAGKTYYIVETTAPPGYPASDDIIRITLNNRGTAAIGTTALHGPNGVETEGFAVIHQSVNDTLKIVGLTVTNQKDTETTEVRVEKTWAAGSTDLPKSITVFLTADGVPVGRTATLHEGNGWSYTWTGLPKYKDEGVDEEVEYVVQEVLVPGYITTQGSTKKVENYVDWVRVDQMSDSKTYLLVHNGQALTYNGSGFGWMEPTQAELDASLSAQWNVTTDHDGFHLKNGLGYTLTFNSDRNSFYGIDSDAMALNQVIYYLNSRLVVHDHDVYYQFGTNGAAVSSDGMVFTLYQKETLTGFLTEIVNVPVDKEDQTFVEVTKVWTDGNENHSDDSVTFSLYADGVDTGRDLVLDAASGWTGGFYELPYYQEDGVTPAVYTVQEDTVDGYAPFYADPEVLDPIPVTLWVGTGSITADSIFRFTSGSTVMAVNNDNEVVAAVSDLNDTDQQWKAVYTSGKLVLQNVGSGRYLRLYGSSLTTTSSAYSAASVTVNNGKVMLGSVYLEIKSGYVGVTTNAANITDQKITVMTTVYGMPGTGFTVTNAPARYELPNTGGESTLLPAFGALLMIAAATLMYVNKFGRKRQKGGS